MRISWWCFLGLIFVVGVLATTVEHERTKRKAGEVSKNGFEIASGVVDIMSKALKKENGGEGLKKLLKFLAIGSTSLGVVGTILLLFLPAEENQDLAFIKKSLEAIETKIDDLTNEFRDFVREDDFKRAKDLLFQPLSELRSGMSYLEKNFQHDLNSTTCPNIKTNVFKILHIANGDIELADSIFDSLYKSSNGNKQKIIRLGQVITFYVAEGIILAMACEKLKLYPKSDSEIAELFNTTKLEIKINGTILNCEVNVDKFITNVVSTVSDLSSEKSNDEISAAIRKTLDSQLDWLKFSVIVMKEDQQFLRDYYYDVESRPNFIAGVATIKNHKERDIFVMYFENDGQMSFNRESAPYLNLVEEATVCTCSCAEENTGSCGCALSATTLAKDEWSSCEEENLAYLKYLEVKLVASDFAMAIFTGNSFGQNHSDGVTNVGRIGSISSVIILRPDQSNNIAALFFDGPFGEWVFQKPHRAFDCFITKFKTKVEEKQGWWGDDTAMTAVDFTCENPGGRSIFLSSPSLDFGDYGETQTCEGGFNAAQTRTEFPHNSNDVSGLNCLRMQCSSNDEWYESSCQIWGDWSPTKKCPSGMKICDVNYKFQEYLGAGSGDDTGLNGLEFLCCSLV